MVRRPPLSELRDAVDGYELDRAFERTCPSCTREYEAGDTLVVCVHQSPSGAWTDVTIVCVECNEQSLSDDHRNRVRAQALVEVDLAATPVAYVLNGDTAELLEYAPAATEL